MNERTGRAISLATEVVRGRGVAMEPVVLADSNHVVVRFGEIVAPDRHADLREALDYHLGDLRQRPPRAGR